MNFYPRSQARQKIEGRGKETADYHFAVFVAAGVDEPTFYSSIPRHGIKEQNTLLVGVCMDCDREKYQLPARTYPVSFLFRLKRERKRCWCICVYDPFQQPEWAAPTVGGG